MSLIRKIKTCIKSVKNIIRWIPALWIDRDYDEHFLYLILLKKLKNKEKFFRSGDTYIEDAIKVADEIREIIDVLDRLVESDMVNIYFKEACKQVGVTDYKVGMCGSREIWELEDELTQKDIEKVFSKELSEKIRGWWD